MGFDGGLSSVGQYVKEMTSHGSEMEDRMFCAIGRANENLYLSGKGDKYAIYQHVCWLFFIKFIVSCSRLSISSLCIDPPNKNDTSIDPLISHSQRLS